jgi:hypothetical protein
MMPTLQTRDDVEPAALERLVAYELAALADAYEAEWAALPARERLAWRAVVHLVFADVKERLLARFDDVLAGWVPPRVH